jgi:hypothetical protein
MPRIGDELITAEMVQAYLDPRNHGICDLCPIGLAGIGTLEQRAVAICNGECIKRQRRDAAGQ